MDQSTQFNHILKYQYQLQSKLRKRDNQDIDKILNGVNEKNIQSHFVLKNFKK